LHINLKQVIILSTAAPKQFVKGVTHMNRKIYRALAKKHGVSAKEVKRDLQEAVNETYRNPTFFARCVERRGERPAIDEFIDHLARRVKEEYDRQARTGD